MIRLALALSIVVGSAVAIAKGSYSENKAKIDHDCGKDPDATIMANEGTFTFTGACGRISVMGNRNTITVGSAKEVSVTGNDNTVSVDAAERISTPGSNNKVAWKKGASGKAPTIANPGKGNTIASR
jgi:Protein of unknown function (DUF3060)